jgi:hypothetical protein
VLVRMFFGVFAPRPRPAARGDAHMPRGSSREAIGVAVAGTLHGRRPRAPVRPSP